MVEVSTVQLVQVKKNIDVSSICAVERVDRNAFRRNNMLQVIQRISDQEMTTTYICTKARTADNTKFTFKYPMPLHHAKPRPSFYVVGHGHCTMCAWVGVECQ